MFARLTSIVAALCLVANVILGCAIMLPQRSAEVLTTTHVMPQTSSVMAGCHETSPAKNHHPSTGTFCKAFCASLACSELPKDRTIALIQPPEVAIYSVKVHWHSGVDPPYPILM